MTKSTPPGSQLFSASDMDTLRPKLHRYCTRMVGSVLDGEDIVQDTLLRALQSDQQQRIENPEGWLFRIAHNLALDHLRQRARRADTQSEGDMDSIVDPIDEQARRDAAAASLPTLMRIPVSQRSAIILFDVLEYSAEEVGEILDTTVPAVKSILQRARGRLKMLANNPAKQDAQAPLLKEEQELLRRYVDLFNARDFDALRTMLAADVRLDLVNRVQLQGPAVGEYFGQYGLRQGWKAWAGVVEGRPALLMQQQARADNRPDYFVVIGIDGQRISTIRDFFFARYVLADAEHSVL